MMASLAHFVLTAALLSLVAQVVKGVERRRAQKLGVRPLKLHCARHTWATFALQAGRNIRWVADQLGHADPALPLRVYAHSNAGGGNRPPVRRIRRPRTALSGTWF